jgi:hypothetical protein
MERMHERRMEQQGGGLSARAERRAMEAQQRRQRERQAREECQQITEQVEELYAGGTVTGREPGGILSGVERSLRYMQMYSAGPRRMAEMTISNREDHRSEIITAEAVEAVRQGIVTQMNSDIMRRLSSVYGIDMGRDPEEGLSEDEKVHRRERLRIIHAIMDARRLQGHTGSDFEDTVVRLARELVTHEEDFTRAEAQKHKRSAVNVKRTLHFGEDDFETGCNEEARG